MLAVGKKVSLNFKVFIIELRNRLVVCEESDLNRIQFFLKSVGFLFVIIIFSVVGFGLGDEFVIVCVSQEFSGL